MKMDSAATLAFSISRFLFSDDVTLFSWIQRNSSSVHFIVIVLFSVCLKALHSSVLLLYLTQKYYISLDLKRLLSDFVHTKLTCILNIFI